MKTGIDPLLGKVLDGRYEIVEMVARGGMAMVYRGRDTRLDREVAIKVMHAHLVSDDDFVERFRAEAVHAAKLSHPNLVSVYDQGRDGDVVYLVMEYLPSITLRDRLKGRLRLSPRESIVILDAILSALAVVHASGIIHRDLKPDNILLGRDGQTKLADFGLARAISTSTTTNTLIGTVGYVAPELVTRSETDIRSDLYTVGIMFYEMLTGTPPYTDDMPIQVAYRHVHDTVPPPSDKVSYLSPKLDALVLWATSKDPEDRPADADALRLALLDARTELPDSELDFGPSLLPEMRGLGPVDEDKVDRAAAERAKFTDSPVVFHDHDSVDRRLSKADAKAAKAKQKAPAPRTAIIPDPEEAAAARMGTPLNATAKLDRGVDSAARAQASAAGDRADAAPAVTAASLGAADAPVRAEDLRAAGRTEDRGAVDSDSTSQESPMHRLRGRVLAASAAMKTAGSKGLESMRQGRGPEATKADERTAQESGPVLVGAMSAPIGRSNDHDRGRAASTAILGPGTPSPVDVPAGGGPVDLDSEGPGDPDRFNAIDDSPKPRRRAGLLASLAAACVLLLVGWFFVSGPGSFREVPTDVTGLDQAEVEQSLSNLGLNATTAETFDDMIPAGKVVGTDPAGGERVGRGEEITVLLSKGPELFKVPDIVGSSQQDATTELTKSNLAVGDVKEKFSESVKKGDVISQSVDAGAQHKGGTTVGLVVSKGREPVEVPQVKGLDYSSASATLGRDGFLVAKKEQFSESVPRGKVISQTPSAGENRYQRDLVTLTVSQGPKDAAIPDVKGKSTGEATSILEGAGFKVSVDKPDKAKDKVASQSPAAGKRAQPGSTVTVKAEK